MLVQGNRDDSLDFRRGVKHHVCF